MRPLAHGYVNLNTTLILEQALFEAVFCYFPITFRPPPNDPYGITAQDLKAQLRDCIAASPYLAPFAIPQLLEKLDSSSLNTKVSLNRPRSLRILRSYSGMFLMRLRLVRTTMTS